LPEARRVDAVAQLHTAGVCDAAQLLYHACGSSAAEAAAVLGRAAVSSGGSEAFVQLFVALLAEQAAAAAVAACREVGVAGRGVMGGRGDAAEVVALLAAACDGDQVGRRPDA